ncbi:hypothetical protein SAMN05216534_1351 [Candidatus Aquiluna sp. UB-MaderosW2red]|jgi:hypothetical protein|nr:hypothetical protein SAMN05216534_1351 [Candidatus Aquiluna sp. UB-MaderosW2red]
MNLNPILQELEVIEDLEPQAQIDALVGVISRIEELLN